MPLRVIVVVQKEPDIHVATEPVDDKMKEKKLASAFQDPLSDQSAVGGYESTADWTESYPRSRTLKGLG